MSLKQSVIVVSEYTVKNPRDPRSRGSRGGSPGFYVERYMARVNATESLAPIKRARTDDFILRYMAREAAVEHAPTRIGAKRRMRRAQGRGGVAFGYGSVSLSDQQLKAASTDIQRCFDQGKTVMKTVLSFDEEYLREHGIIDSDFRCERRGDYRGHIDQMKLRMAIMHGLRQMSRGRGGFDDLRYVGVIQVDTEHVHCHLAMVDAGAGRVMKDGTQRGKLTDQHKSRLRRGTDAWLDDKRVVARLSSAVGYERRNVTSYIKRWAHQKMQAESLPQFLLACLPADRSLWRASSRARSMRKANQVVRELVTEQLERPGSPLPAAMEQVRAYADQRRVAEELDGDAWQRLVDQGRERIFERAVNGVYSLLRSLPEDELRIRTPLLDIMGMDDEQMAARAGNEAAPQPPDRRGDGDTAAGEDLISFGFRLRSYASRLEHHTKRREAYHDLAHQWEVLARRVSDEETAASRPLYDFYRFEEDYHARCMSKYRHFLPFIGDQERWYRRQEEVAGYGRRMLSLIGLRHDSSLQRMKDGDEAERLGREIYGQSGGRLLAQGEAGRVVLDERIANMREVYAEKLVDLGVELSAAGLVLVAEPADPAQSGNGDAVGELDRVAAAGTTIEPGAPHGFAEVKSVDLHHLAFDFIHDVAIGENAKRIFVETARRRRAALLAAIDYLDSSGQEKAIGDLPVADVAAMTRLAGELAHSSEARLRSRLAELRAAHADAGPMSRSKTTSLDNELAVRVRSRVDHAVTRDVDDPGKSRETLGHE